MSQSDCLRVLESKEIWISTQYFKNVLKIGSASDNLKKFFNQKLVKRLEFIDKEGKRNYMFKIKK